MFQFGMPVGGPMERARESGVDEMAELARQMGIEQEETAAWAASPREPGTVVALQTVTIGFPKKSLVFGILMAFALCFTILYRYGMVSEMNLKLGKMNREYTQLRET